MSGNTERGQFIRVSEKERPEVTIHVDGQAVTAMTGDTVLTALMLAGTQVRKFEFGEGARAGFCLMGACQDCWVKLEEGGSLRACSAYVHDGLRLTTGSAAT